jgi:hypothetical protein
MRIFYRGPRALISAEVITVARTSRHSFVLAELDGVHIVRQQGGHGPAGHRAMGVSALVSSVLTIPIIGPVSRLLAVAVIATLVLYAVVCMRLGPPAHHELVADYRGRRTVIFDSDDQREFDQVCRGLQRALEQVR